MRLKDKTIIVTGGTSGIGAAIARAVVREGGTVLVHGINQSEGEALVKVLGTSAQLFIADLREASAPEVIVKACLNHFGKIDGIVNNAAVIKNANISQLTFAEYLSLIHI